MQFKEPSDIKLLSVEEDNIYHCIEIYLYSVLSVFSYTIIDMISTNIGYY